MLTNTKKGGKMPGVSKIVTNEIRAAIRTAYMNKLALKERLNKTRPDYPVLIEPPKRGGIEYLDGAIPAERVFPPH